MSGRSEEAFALPGDKRVFWGGDRCSRTAPAGRVRRSRRPRRENGAGYRRQTTAGRPRASSCRYAACATPPKRSAENSKSFARESSKLPKCQRPKPVFVPYNICTIHDWMVEERTVRLIRNLNCRTGVTGHIHGYGIYPTNS